MAKKFSLEAIVSLADGVTKPVKDIEKSMTKFSGRMKKNFGGLGKDLSAANQAIDKTAKAAAVGVGVLAAGAFVAGKSFIEAGKDVEKYKTVLKTMLGTQELANERFAEYSEIAAVTPFELNDVVELGNQLQALGRYSRENMIMLGDLAAASGKPIDQVTGAFAKLVSGQKGEGVNMFRDLLISTNDWVEATGKGIKKSGELEATTEEMIAALPKILGKKGFSGMMDNLAKSADGMESNFKDTITRFRQGIGSALLPAYKELLAVAIKLAEKVSAMFTANSAKYIEKISAAAKQFADYLMALDIEKLVEDFTNFMKTVKAVYDFLKPMIPVILALVAAIKIASIAMGVFNVVMWVLSLNPITLTILAIVAAVAVLAVGIAWMVKHWDQVVAVLKIVGGFFVNIGQTIMKWLLLPINLSLEAIQAMLKLLSKIPGMSDKIAPALSFVEGFQNKMNTTLTGTAGATDFGGVWKGEQRYASPSTQGAESRVSTTTTNEVFVRPDKGATVSATKNGPPAQYLRYGMAQ